MGTFTNLLQKYRFSGFLTFIKLKIGRTNNIKLKGIKHPIQLRPRSSDVTTFKHIFAHGDYAFEVDVIPQVIIDAGGNVGLAAIYFANRYPEAKIYSVELAPSNFKVLLKNIQDYSSITAINAGIWHKKEILKFREKGSSPWGYKVENALHQDSISVPSITIDEICDKYNINIIDILKVDIEGAEVELFSENYSNWLPKVNYLVIETHDRWRVESTETVRNALAKFDFENLGEVGENLIFRNNSFCTSSK